MGGKESRFKTVTTSEGLPEERISGLPIGKPLYLKSAIDPTLYLQVEKGILEGRPSNMDNYSKLRFQEKSQDAEESSMWWLVEPISTSSFRLKHVETGFFVKCSRGGEDPQGILHLAADIPWFGKNVLEFTLLRHASGDDAPFRLECASTKVYGELDAVNKRAMMIDGRLIDWPRVGPGEGGWLVGGIDSKREEGLREGGHIFLWEKVETHMVVTLCLHSSEDGHVCNCTTLTGDVIAQQNVSSGDKLADIRSLLLAKVQERNKITGLVLVTGDGNVLGYDNDSKGIIELIS